jgi:putative ABC transport system permease protein
VLIENMLLLCGGLFTGLLAALLAVLPHMYLGGASLPWLDLLWMLTAILVIGGLVGLVAVRATLKAPILAALRGE